MMDEEKVTQLDKIRAFLNVVRRAERKAQEMIRQPKSVYDVIDATEGGDKAGDKYPLGSKNYKSFIKVEHTLQLLSKYLPKNSREREILDAFKSKVEVEFYLRSHTSHSLTYPIAQTVIDYIGKELPENLPIKLSESKEKIIAEKAKERTE